MRFFISVLLDLYKRMTSLILDAVLFINLAVLYWGVVINFRVVQLIKKFIDSFWKVCYTNLMFTKG